MKELMIVGQGGLAKEVTWLAEECGYKVAGFVIQETNNDAEENVNPKDKILVKDNDWAKFIDLEFVVAIGSPSVRKKVVEKMSINTQPKFATLIHPSVNYSKHTSFGEGSIICAGVCLTVDVILGKHCIINLNSTIGHDVKIGDFCTISPLVAISGNVVIGSGVEIGTGSSVKQGISIGERSMLGMGSCLTKNMEESSLFYGIPAKKIKSLSL